jgi:hypothetical protein
VSVAAAVSALYAGHAEPLAPSVTYAFGADPADECAPRTLVTGREAAFAALEGELAGGQAAIETCAVDGRDCLVEVGVPGLATIGASLRLDRAGAIERVLSFRTRPVGRRPGVDAGDAQAVLATYLERLEEGDFEGAAACFSADVLYSHPPYAPGGERFERHGREDLLAAFVARGPRSWRHRVLTCVQQGGECLVEGDVEGLGVWLSSFSLDEQGLISRYCSFYARL